MGHSSSMGPWYCRICEDTIVERRRDTCDECRVPCQQCGEQLSSYFLVDEQRLCHACRREYKESHPNATEEVVQR